MNAFLIFCKRHRAQVREKYPHLENRQVTKILGEWWADLPAHQKTSYTELARQYKEAFLRANPDFKWYKIPAQPPRPPPARPSNQKVPRATEPLPTDGAITFGKLADEAQMGGLSTLLSTALAATTSSNSISSGLLSLSSSSSFSNSSCVSTADTSTVHTAATTLSSLTSSNLMGITTNTHRHSSTTATTSMPSTSTSLGSLSPSVAAAWSGRGVGLPHHQRNGSASPSPAAHEQSSSFRKYSSFNGISGSVMTTAIGSSRNSSSSNNNNMQPTDSASHATSAMTPPRPPKKRYLHENQHHNSSVSPSSLSPNVLENKPPDIDKNKACSALLQLSQASSLSEDKCVNKPSSLSSNWSSSSSFPTSTAESRGLGSANSSSNISNSSSGCDIRSSTSESGTNGSAVVWSNLGGAAEAVRKAPLDNTTASPADTSVTAAGGRGHVRGGVEEGGGSGGVNRGGEGAGDDKSPPRVFHTLENLHPQEQQQQPTHNDEQPLNLSTETTIHTSNKELINNIVDKMYNGQMPARDLSSTPRFFRPENLNNNVEKKDEKKAKANGLTKEINGVINCDMNTLVSKTIEVVLNKRVNENGDKHEKVRLSREGCKGLFSQNIRNSDNSLSKSTSSNNASLNFLLDKEEHNKETVVTSSSIINNISNNNSSFNTTGSSSSLGRGKKRNKEEEDVDVAQKKRREVHVGSQGRGSNSSNGRGAWRDGGMVAEGRSRVQRACKGQRYEKLISEGVLQAPRRSRSKKAEDIDVPSSQDVEDEMEGDFGKETPIPLTQHYQQQQQHKQQPKQEHQEDAPPPVEEEAEKVDDNDIVNTKSIEEDNGEVGARKSEESSRRGRKPLRRLRPDDFDLEARIEALPKLNLDDFTRRKKERKRTSSASASSTHSSLQNSNNSLPSHTSPHSTQAQAGVVSSSSRVSAMADSTSDPHTSPAPSHQYTSQSPLVTGSGSCNVLPSGHSGNSVSSSSSSSNGVGGSGCHLSDGDSTTTSTITTSTSLGPYSGLSTPNNRLNGGRSNIVIPHVNGGSLALAMIGRPALAMVATEHNNTSSGNQSLAVNSESGPLIGSQKRKARKQTITRHDPKHATINRTSVVEADMLSRINLVALAEVALSQPGMKP